jgi:alcohol dehydrogenase class IV
VRIAARALPVAFRDGANLQARGDMLMSSMMGAIAFQKDLGAVHSCAHALSTVADLHHGLANGIMIDHVMRFNLSSATAKLAELARVAAVAGAAASTDDAAAAAFIDWLARLKHELGIPAQLGGLTGTRAVTAADIPALVVVASNDICHHTNPRKCEREDFERIFAAAL